MEIGNGLYRIASRLGPRYVYQYLLVDEYGALLVDAGMKETPEQAIIPALKQLGLRAEQLRWLIISHSDVDHYSGVNRMRELNDSLTVMAHEADVAAIEQKEIITRQRYFYYETLGVSHDQETKEWFLNSIEPTHVDIALTGGETLKLGPDRIIDMIHTPGHSAGHLTLYDRQNKAAIVIDAILWKGLFDTEQNIISPPPYYAIDAYMRTIDKVLCLPYETLLTGHYDVMQGQTAKTFMDESKAFVITVGQTVAKIIEAASEPLSLSKVLQMTNQAVGPYTNMMVELVGPVYAHLRELERSEKAFRMYVGGIPHWHI